MQLGFVTAILPEMSLEQVLDHAAAIGYECVEIMCWPPGEKDRKYGGVVHLDVTEFTQARADETLALCRDRGVAISALGYYPNPLSDDAEQAKVGREHLPKVMDAAARLGLTTVNTFVGANHRLSLDENFDLFEKVWPDLIRHAEQKNIRVGIENCPMLWDDTWPSGSNIASSPAIWRRMFEAIPSPNFGLNYDPSHLRMQLMDPIGPIREFGDRIFHAHAKDMRVDLDRLDDVGTLVLPMERCTAKIPGLGDIDWGTWIGALTDAGYNGPVCVEVEDEAFVGSLEGRIRSLEVSYRVLRPLIA